MPTPHRASLRAPRGAPAQHLFTIALSHMARNESAADDAARDDGVERTDLSDPESRTTESGSTRSEEPVDDLGHAMSEQRKSLLRAWAPIVNRLRKASLPVTFAFDEPGGYWAFVVRRLDAVGFVVAEEHDNSITLRAITMPQQTTPDAPSKPTYGTSDAPPPFDASDASMSSLL